VDKVYSVEELLHQSRIQEEDLAKRGLKEQFEREQERIESKQSLDEWVEEKRLAIGLPLRKWLSKVLPIDLETPIGADPIKQEVTDEDRDQLLKAIQDSQGVQHQKQQEQRQKESKGS
jgi:hypothetical protein